MHRFFVVSVGLIVAIGGCHADGEDSQALATEPPWGLGSSDMPGEASSLAAVFAAMPATLDEVVVADSSPLGVVHAEGGERYLSVGAVSAAEMRAFAGAEMSPLRCAVDDGRQRRIGGGGATALRAGEPLVWIAAPGIGDDELAYVASWGAPDGSWLFSATADTVEARTNLVHVLIRACAQVL